MKTASTDKLMIVRFEIGHAPSTLKFKICASLQVAQDMVVDFGKVHGACTANWIHENGSETHVGTYIDPKQA